MRLSLDYQGCSLLADGGFNPMSPLLITEDNMIVAPPFKRKKEPQFTAAGIDSTFEVAKLPFHVETSGAVKKPYPHHDPVEPQAVAQNNTAAARRDA